jgi:hypothetical protein
LVRRLDGLQEFIIKGPVIDFLHNVWIEYKYGQESVATGGRNRAGNILFGIKTNQKNKQTAQKRQTNIKDPKYEHGCQL